MRAVFPPRERHPSRSGLAQLGYFLFQHPAKRFIGNAVLDVGLGIAQLAPRPDVRLNVGVAGQLVALRGQRLGFVFKFLFRSD
ncbi:hypothetical protein [Nitrosovibrio sp. Nv4]|uniref:hypothetical protein n=1 Tax=Nitrosovibrio sp. Nv4 TaxID=1945880 RepID=UPI000D323617|nr:hypothetical protein [Nitrosovibrio sp. Nv4]